jgi:GxxExxY protein
MFLENAKGGDMKQPVLRTEELIARKIVDAAFTVHKRLGPGLLEAVYETCFCYELEKRGLAYHRQMPLPLRYDNIEFKIAYRLDVLVEDCIVCEIKAIESLADVHFAQVLTYLRFSGKRLGFLVNFNSARFRDGIHRLIL